ncbi:hypothetical protein ORI20_32300 [Mycobacterium sp. CVI_P3]|uniref:Secreted protein n=1 Tax=Mycobacterium pinniadriaticum TaxID=2994102 RepID=A0ABT3SPT3_9MYCO|nr:hypothetical protein [Mycobacterium pinniadriaticum]MCX2934945.1 hypothetical protein [Mycobacterium pinniadriaticum]MCX2941367.1 hypothetical protein [Mycobacterium pinniadriaticum]
MRNRYPAAVGAGAVGAAVLAAALAAAAPAQADRVVSADEICAQAYPGTHAVVSVGGVYTTCAKPGTALPGMWTNNFNLNPGNMDELPYGSHRVDPGNLLSDWVIPDNPDPAPPLMRCDRISGQIICTSDNP